MKRLNGFSEVLRGSERFFMTSEKFSGYFSEVYNPNPDTLYSIAAVKSKETAQSTIQQANCKKTGTSK